MDTTKFKALLDDQMNWPEEYTFKWVVKSEHKDHALSLLTEHTVQQRDSKTGKFTSITTKKIVHSSEDVVAVYSMMNQVEGIMSL